MYFINSHLLFNKIFSKYIEHEKMNVSNINCQPIILKRLTLYLIYDNNYMLQGILYRAIYNYWFWRKK